MNRMSRAVAALLILNVAVFAAGVLVPAWHDLLETGGAFWFPKNPNFRVWQTVTYLFLHGNFSHIFFNMFALFSFGSILEREWGAARFLIFYFLCGIGAGLVQTGINWHEFGVLHERLVAAGMTPGQIDIRLKTATNLLSGSPAVRGMLVDLYQIYAVKMLGASGAIYGLLVAFGCLHPNAKLAVMFVPVPVAAKYFIPIVVALDLFSGVTGFSLFGAGIAHFAHVGGAVIGFLLMLLWRKRGRIPADPGAIAPHPTT